MNIDLTEVLKIGIILLSGGAAGAIIKAIIDKHNNRIQIIRKSVEISIFTTEKILANYYTKITLSSSTSIFHFDNLYKAKIYITNLGNKDFNEFKFGLTAPENVEIINVYAKGEDRHHNIASYPIIDFNNKSEIVDFELKPFNRKNFYMVELLLTATDLINKLEIEFSTDLPVRFTEAKTVSVTTGEIIGTFLKAAINFR